MRMLVLVFALNLISVGASKGYTGQRVFVDTPIIDFADPAKHGFHIVLNEEFVNTHLQPIRLPTVFATAIALRRQSEHQRLKNDTTSSTTSNEGGGLRVIKILYPENVNPDDGLLDGRTIKLLGLRERTWYYVCVEFESNLNRHESATGTSCRLKRTLDKFGKNVDSTIGDVELGEVTDRSITIHLRVDADFPLRLTAYLNHDRPSQSASASQPPAAQTYLVDRSQTLSVTFDHLRPDTSYGSLCIFEEPLPIPTVSYTAMARALSANMHHCYFDDLKTSPVALKVQERQRLQSSNQQLLTGKRALSKSGGDGAAGSSYSCCVSSFVRLLLLLVLCYFR